ncbi:MAG TPA: ATP-binding protein [bacterium]|nr:ATP-binding protein [bacterium]
MSEVNVKNSAKQGKHSPLEQTKIRFRLIIVIPVITTLLVLGVGWYMIELSTRELLIKSTPETVMQYRASVQTTIEHSTIAVVVGGIFSLAIGIVMAYAITAPIRKLTDDTTSIARGDLSRTIHLSGDGEIAMLGSAFNNMLSSINQYLLQTMSGGVVTINDRGEITSISADAEVILGFNARDMIGRDIKDMIPYNRDNRKFHKVISETLEQRQTFSSQEMTITTDRREAIPISISTSFLRDHDNTLIGLIVSFEDVKHLRKIQEQMRIVDRLTMLGGLAAGIAHQVRNPLCSIRGLAQLLKENSETESLLTEYSNVILSDVDRIDRVVDRLLKFIQPSSSSWSFESLNEIVDDTILLSKHEIRKKEIELQIDYDDDLPMILCQRENLMQAIMNIVVNAFQAIDIQGRVSIRTRKSIGETEDSFGEICLEISDNGGGIAPEDMDRIFDPSFTTKEDGSGFGLAITKQTVEIHGGNIDFFSENGDGSTFTIWLPIKKQRNGEA